MAVIIAQAIEDYVSDIDGAENLTKIVLSGFYFHAAFYLILGAAEFYVVFASVYAENKYELMMAALNSIALGLVPLIEDTVGNRRSSESVRRTTTTAARRQQHGDSSTPPPLSTTTAAAAPPPQRPRLRCAIGRRVSAGLRVSSAWTAASRSITSTCSATRCVVSFLSFNALI